jgi:hypothetical protein
MSDPAVTRVRIGRRLFELHVKADLHATARDRPLSSVSRLTRQGEKAPHLDLHPIL